MNLVVLQLQHEMVEQSIGATLMTLSGLINHYLPIN